MHVYVRLANFTPTLNRFRSANVKIFVFVVCSSFLHGFEGLENSAKFCLAESSRFTSCLTVFSCPTHCGVIPTLPTLPTSGELWSTLC